METRNPAAANSVMVIHPYKQHPDSPIWVFDDQRHGLVAEPFVGDINQMIDRLLESKEISTAWQPYAFSLLFSANPLPDADLHLEWVSGDTGNDASTGNIYRSPFQELEGWLCPALFHYFAHAPEKIYIKAQAGTGTGLGK